MADSIDWVKSLVQIMNQNGIAELSLEEEGRKVRLRKTGEPPRGAGLAAPAPSAAAPAASAAPAAAAARAPDTFEVNSPMVGTFYRSPSPEADPFVNVGDPVALDATICIIEAMKVMNEIKAEQEGTVVEVLVENGEAVEFGQAMFIMKRK